MLKKHIKLIVILFIVFGYSWSNACELKLKDGRIIEAEFCWEENGRIKWNKYGATMSIEKEKVEEIIDTEYVKPEKKSYGAAVVVLKNGKMMQTEKTWEEGDKVSCQIGKRTYTYDKKEVASISKASFTTSSDMKKPVEKKKKRSRAQRPAYYPSSIKNKSSSKAKKSLTREQKWALGDCKDDCKDDYKCEKSCARPYHPKNLKYTKLKNQSVAYKKNYRNTIRACNARCSDRRIECLQDCKDISYK